MRATKIALVLTLCVSACEPSKSGGTDTGNGFVKLGVAVPASPAGALSQALVSAQPGLDDDLFLSDDAGNVLHVTGAALVLRELQLEVQEDTRDCEDDDDACEDIEIGPMVVDLPLGGGVSELGLTDVLPGTYDEIEFDIHKLSEDDAEVLQQRPELAELSTRVTGTYNSQAFVFTSDVDEELELELTPPLVVTGDNRLNVTLAVDLRTWFASAALTLLNPGDEENASEIEENIKRSIRGFEDDDEDGEEDDHEEDDSHEDSAEQDD